MADIFRINYAIIMSQECDLFQDYSNILEKLECTMMGILAYKMFTVDEIRETNDINSKLWDRIWKNLDDRYHYLEACPKESDLLGVGFPSLVVDFKRYFTVFPPELYSLLKSDQKAKRRCKLERPYREHFQTRSAFYLQRVELPLTHRKDTPNL